jgi:hypothetical protein
LGIINVKPFEPIDEETGIDDYPGHLGMTWDGEISMTKPLARFQRFGWDGYSNLLEEAGRSAEIKYRFRQKICEVEYEPFADVAYVVDEMTTVEVQRDDGASYGGMASGSGYIFFLKDGYSLPDAYEEFDCLVSALEDDLRQISIMG